MKNKTQEEVEGNMKRHVCIFYE